MVGLPTDDFYLPTYKCAGSGLTTTLVALIANAAPEDQAIATAGKAINLLLVATM